MSRKSFSEEQCLTDSIFCWWMATVVAYSVPFKSYYWLSMEFSSVWQFVLAALYIFCGSSWHHMCCVYVALDFVMYKEQIEICNSLFYLMVLHGHLFHALFNWLLKIGLRGIFFKRQTNCSLWYTRIIIQHFQL